MRVKFRSSKLRKQYEDHDKAERAYGSEVGRKYIQRIGIIQSVKSLAELMDMPAIHCHPLKGDKRGQHGIKLTRRARLIFTVENDGPVICIEEVSQHYGD